MNIKNPYGFRDGRLIHISELGKSERGLKCNCVCPSCKGKLVARMGEKNIKNFSHYNADCENGLETTLHLLAKEIILKAKKIQLPNLSVEYSYTATNPKSFTLVGTKDNKEAALTRGLLTYKDKDIVKDIIIDVDKVEDEVYLKDIIPDIRIYSNGNPLLVEIAVTHKVDDIKAQKIRDKNISTFEIDLSNIVNSLATISKKQIAYEILVNPDNRYWIYNKRVEKIISVAIKENEEEIVERKKILDKELEQKRSEGTNVKVSSGENKYGTCNECGTYTNDWNIYNGDTNTVTCRDCSYKDRDIKYTYIPCD